MSESCMYRLYILRIKNIQATRLKLNVALISKCLQTNVTHVGVDPLRTYFDIL